MAIIKLRRVGADPSLRGLRRNQPHQHHGVTLPASSHMVETTLQPQERNTSTLSLQCPFIYKGENADLVLLSVLEPLILQPLQ